MERIIDRLDEWMLTSGRNDNRVTVECKLSVGLINQARRGKTTDLGKKAVSKILNQYPEINATWLLTGEGEMLSGEGLTPTNLFADSSNTFAAQKPGIYERMLQILDFEGTTIRQYELSHFIFPGTFNNAIKRADKKITYGWVTGLLDSYPAYSMDWVLYGEGEPLRENRPQRVPYAKEFLTAKAEQDSYILSPNIHGADSWMQISDTSMSPLINPMDVIALQLVASPDDIIYGHVYALVTDKLRTVRRIRRSDQEGRIKIVPANPDFDSEEISVSAISTLYKVIGCTSTIV